MIEEDKKEGILKCRKNGASLDFISKIFEVDGNEVANFCRQALPNRSHAKPAIDHKILTIPKRELQGLPTQSLNSIFKNGGGRDFVRELVRIRDKRICQNCKKKWIEGTRRLDVHHLDEEMESTRSCKWDREHMDRMITYCHKCHLNLDSVRKKMSITQRKPYKKRSKNGVDK